MNKTIAKIKKTIVTNNLIPENSKILIALSGGADSVFMLHVLSTLSTELKFKLYAAHVEHGIRAESAVSDLRFSEGLCKKMNVPFFWRSYNVPQMAAELKISEETAGRKVRYEFFDEISQENGLDLIATAHHRDDKIETILMNMLRGAGLRGFTGIEYKNRNVIRPILDISKREIEEYCKLNGIEYCTDETNYELVYKRNKIRHKLIPALKEYNPSFEEVLIRESSILAEEDAFLQKTAEEELKKCMSDGKLNISKLNSSDVAIRRRVIYLYISKVKGTCRDISFEDVDSILKLCNKSETGKKISISNNYEALISYGSLLVEKKKTVSDFEYTLNINEWTEIPEIGLRFKLIRADDAVSQYKISENDKIIIRNRRNGDYFYPTQMTGKKKLKDFFIDKKIGRSGRQSIPLLEINGQLAAVIGLRNDRRFITEKGGFQLISEKI